jgi:hypothetical protein
MKAIVAKKRSVDRIAILIDDIDRTREWLSLLARDVCRTQDVTSHRDSEDSQPQTTWESQAFARGWNGLDTFSVRSHDAIALHLLFTKEELGGTVKLKSKHVSPRQDRWWYTKENVSTERTVQ